MDGMHAMNDDLRMRLQSSRREERAARAHARRMSRELALSRRLLAFAYGTETPARTAQRPPEPTSTPQVRAAVIQAGALFVLDSCRSNGTHVVVAGWAFPPVEGWNSMLAVVTLLFRHGESVYIAAAGRVARADVAAHFSSQPREASGGACGLASCGFAAEIANDSLPADVDLEVILRLEAEGRYFEQPTGVRLRLE